MSLKHQLLPILLLIALMQVVEMPQAKSNNTLTDSLKVELVNCQDDSLRIEFFRRIGRAYGTLGKDSALLYYQMGLKAAEENQQTQLKGKLLFDLGRMYHNGFKDSISYDYLRQSLGVFTDLKDTLGMSFSLQNLGLQHITNGQSEKGIAYTEKAIEYAQKVGRFSTVASGYNVIAVAKMRIGENLVALKYLLRCDSIRKQANLPPDAGTFINIGAMYINHSNDPEKALEYYFKGLEASIATNNTAYERTCYQNIGVAYTNLESFDQAIEYLTKANEINKKLNDQSAISRYYTSIADILVKQKQMDAALENYQKAQEVFPENGTQRELMYVHLNLSRAYLQKADSVDLPYLKKSVQEGLIAYRLANDLGLVKNVGECAGVLFQAYKGLGNSGKAVEFAQEYIDTRDALLSEEKIKAIADIQGKYEADKKELEIDLLHQQNALNESKLNESVAQEEKQETIIIAISIGLSLSALLALFLYRLYRQKQSNLQTLTEKNAVIVRQNEEREILLKEIHHRVKNNLQVVSSLLELQTEDIQDLVASQAVEDGQSRVKAMALIHEKLYQNEDVGQVTFEEYTEQLIRQLTYIYNRGNPVDTKVIGGSLSLDIDTAIPLGLILNELVSNALKYAFSEEVDRKLHILLSQPQKGHYVLEVKDNGIGLPEGVDFKQTKTLGLRLVKRLSRQLYGSAEYAFDGGAHFKISFQDTIQRKSVN